MTYVLIFWSLANFNIKIPNTVEFSSSFSCQSALKVMESKGFYGVCVAK